MRRAQKSWKEIDEVLCEHFHSSFLALNRPATAKQIQSLETTVELKLPADFKRSLSIHNGMADGDKYLLNGNFFLSSQKIAERWKMCREVLTIMLADENSRGCRLTKDKRIKNDLWWRLGWIPVLDFNGDYVLIDCDPGRGGKVGQVINFSNYGGSARRVIADSWTQWLDRFAEVLVAREFTVNEFGDLDVEDVDLT